MVVAERWLAQQYTFPRRSGKTKITKISDLRLKSNGCRSDGFSSTGLAQWLIHRYRVYLGFADQGFAQ